MSGAVKVLFNDDLNRRHLHESEARWFALHTPYKREKSAITQLKRLGIECYVPLIERVKKYVRKVKRYQVPLINNYIFVRIKKQDYVKVLNVRDVSAFVKFNNDILCVPEDEIRMLQTVVGEAQLIHEGQRDFEVGSEVEIINGKLTGIRGKVKEERGKHLLLVELETLGWSIPIEVNPKYLQPII